MIVEMFLRKNCFIITSILMMHTFSITSFNCQDVKNILLSVAEMCNKSHIVFLQKTWLTPDELSILKMFIQISFHFLFPLWIYKRA